MNNNGRVVSVALDDDHRFSKRRVAAIRLLAGLGVEGDAHQGETVRHRSRVAADPSQPNLRQVHLIAEEALDELAGKRFILAPADLGENITTRGLDLANLPRGTRLRLGDDAVIEVTGLRNPCAQIEHFRPGLLEAVVDKDGEGLKHKAGVMAIVVASGIIGPGDPITVEMPAEPHAALERV
ncbi:MAG: MOSC domain-containing protein [Sphingobium sp.]|nr:MOSC domain-containing protein [Sphingobium sp.]